MISLIAAYAKNRVIGKNNDLPWHLPADLKRFRQLTSGHAVIMGRNTYEAIQARIKGPLPNRRNIVVSTSLQKVARGFELVHSLEAGLAQAEKDQAEEVFIIGGGTLYKAALDSHLADRLYLTEIDTEVDGGDAWFPELESDRWEEVDRESHQADDKNKFNYTYMTYDWVTHK